MARTAKRAGDLLPKVLKAHGLEPGFKKGQALSLWPRIAGDALAPMTEAYKLEDGILSVRVQDAVAAHQLTYSRAEFLRRYQEELPGQVKEIRFQAGGAPHKKTAAKAESGLPELSLEEESGIHKLAESAPAELREVVFKAARAVIRRSKANPNPPCPVCGTPSEVAPCPNCQKLLQDAAVKREADRLTRRPLASSFEGELLQAAKYLAAAGLEAQLRELMPQVVKEPALMAVLQDTARRYLQLSTGQKEVKGYLRLLPDTLRSLIKEL